MVHARKADRGREEAAGNPPDHRHPRRSPEVPAPRRRPAKGTEMDAERSDRAGGAGGLRFRWARPRLAARRSPARPPRSTTYPSAGPCYGRKAGWLGLLRPLWAFLLVELLIGRREKISRGRAILLALEPAVYVAVAQTLRTRGETPLSRWSALGKPPTDEE